MLLANSDNFTYKMIEEICNPSFDNSLTDFLTNSLTNINSSVTQSVINIMKNSVFSIGSALLVIFMLIELCSLMGKISTDNSQLRGIQIPANILIKFAILAFLFCHSYTILNGIQEIAVQIATNVNSNISINMNTQATVDNVYELISKQSIFEKIYINIMLVLEWLVLNGVMIAIKVTVYFRLFELWIMIAFAPIPLSTIASNEFKGVCFNYLKSFAAISLQSAVILACYKIYGTMVTSDLMNVNGGNLDVFHFVSITIRNNMGYLFVLAVSILGSGRLAKSIIQAQ